MITYTRHEDTDRNCAIYHLDLPDTGTLMVAVECGENIPDAIEEGLQKVYGASTHWEVDLHARTVKPRPETGKSAADCAAKFDNECKYDFFKGVPVKSVTVPVGGPHEAVQGTVTFEGVPIASGTLKIDDAKPYEAIINIRPDERLFKHRVQLRGARCYNIATNEDVKEAERTILDRIRPGEWRMMRVEVQMDGIEKVFLHEEAPDEIRLQHYGRSFDFAAMEARIMAATGDLASATKDPAGHVEIKGVTTGRMVFEKATEAIVTISETPQSRTMCYVSLEGSVIPGGPFCAEVVDDVEGRLLQDVNPGTWYLFEQVWYDNRSRQSRKWLHETSYQDKIIAAQKKIQPLTGPLDISVEKWDTVKDATPIHMVPSKAAFKMLPRNHDFGEGPIVDDLTSRAPLIHKDWFEKRHTTSDGRSAPDECDECRGTGRVELFRSVQPCSRGCRP